jgi:amino acid transporter
MASPQTLEPTQQGFRKRLTLSDVIAQSLSVMALAMSGAFLTYLAATKAGGATPLAYVLGTFGILMIGLTVAQFARDYPSAGGLYTYITVGANRHTGFVAGWTYAAAFLILGGAVLCGFGFFTSLLLQGLTDGGTTVTWYWFSAVGLVFIAVMSVRRSAVHAHAAALRGADRCRHGGHRAGGDRARVAVGQRARRYDPRRGSRLVVRPRGVSAR